MQEQKGSLGVTVAAHKMQSELNTKHAEHKRTRDVTVGEKHVRAIVAQG